MSIIEDAFRLDKAGGVYFEGARVQPMPKEIALFVGLGGTGNEALLHVKNQIHNRMKLPTDERTNLPTAEIPPNFAFIAVDTDSDDVLGKHWANTRFKKDTEILEIGAGQNRSYELIVNDFKSKQKLGYEYTKWLHPDARAKGGIDGAGQRRAIGRIGVFSNYNKIKTKIENVISALNRNNSGFTSLRIFLFAGLGGGTGSGTFVDMAYLLKQIGKNAYAGCQLLGYLFLPDINADNVDTNTNRALYANAFAALKELDCLMGNAQRDIPFKQAYTDSSSDKMTFNFAPFDFCHLINKTDVNSQEHSRTELMESVAANIFEYVANEHGNGNQGVTTLKSLYDNIDNAITVANASSEIPAEYSYVSVSCTNRMIPYIEINTLIACRMFEKLEKTIFSNEVTMVKFNEDLAKIGLGANKEALQDTLTAAIDGNGVQYHNLNKKNYPFRSIWTNNSSYNSNPAYNDAYSDTEQYQDGVASRYGDLPGRFEGYFRAFLKAAFSDKTRGPIYLKNFVYGTQSDNLRDFLTHQAERFHQISLQQNDLSEKALKKVKQFYNDGMDRGLGALLRRRKSVDTYLRALAVWRGRCIQTDKYEYLSQLAYAIRDRYMTYYNNVLKPMADLLEKMRLVFRDNLAYLTTQDADRIDHPNKALLIYPFEFEEMYSTMFNTAVDNAEKTFLDTVLANMRFWIKRDIDNVDKDLLTNPDVAGSFSRFISDCFEVMYHNISMEDVLNAKLPTGKGIVQYAMDIIDDLFNEAYPLFAANAHNAATQDLGIISVPDGCPNIRMAAENYRDNYGLRFEIKSGEEKNYISLIKTRSGYALHCNKLLTSWETNYEEYAAEGTPTSVFMHLDQNWYRYMPSPNVEKSWTGGDICIHTQDENKKIYDDFDKCFKNGTIIHNDKTLQAYLLLPSDIDINSIRLSGTLRDKAFQIDNQEKYFWPQKGMAVDINDTRKWMSMKGIGRYHLGGASQDNSDYLENIKANIVRFPEVRDALRKNCEIYDKLDELRDKYIAYPYYYSKAWVCGMIVMNSRTGDVELMVSPGNATYVTLANKNEMKILHTDPEYMYVLYDKFKPLMEETVNGIKWKDYISKNWDTADTRARQSPDEKNRLINEVKKFGNAFFSYSSQYDTRAISEFDIQKKNKLKDIAEFYGSCSEALAFLLDTLNLI